MPIYGIIISIIFLYFEWDVPGYLENTTFLLTYATIFLVLMSLGIALSRMKVVSWTHASILGGVRVIIGPIIGFALIKFFKFKRFCCGRSFNSILYAKRSFNLFSWIYILRKSS